MFESFFRLGILATACALALSACSGSSSSSSSSSIPPTASNAQVRFVDGTPSLQTMIGSTPQDICPVASIPCYLKADGETVTQLFYYGSMTSFMPVPGGTVSLVARDESGYAVGPLKTTALKGGSTYTVVIVGAYPNYQALTFEEPKNDTNAQLSLYQASPAQPDLDFGRFNASNGSGFTKLGSAHFGNVVTVNLGKSATNLGGYVGHGTTPITCGGSPCGKVTVAQLNSFDRKGALPFNKASRLSLFVFDPKNTASTFGSLDP